MANDKKNHDDIDGPFDQWLRGNKPPKPHFITDMDTFLDGFNEKMEASRKDRAQRLKRNVLSGSALMCVLLLSFAFFDMPYVGSAGFKMIKVTESEEYGRVYKNEFTGAGFNVLGDDTYEQIQEQAMQIEAGEGVAASACGWLFEGEHYWMVTREYYIAGEQRLMTTGSVNPESKFSKVFLRFIMEDWQELENKIDDGVWVPTGNTMVKEIDGVVFSFATWVIDRPGGQVVYFKGKLVSKENSR